MARRLERLKALEVGRLTEPGLHPDGGGLYLRIASGGSKQWLFRYKRNKSVRDMGLGSVHALGLADARKKAAEARRLLAEGQDPITHKRASEAALRASEAHSITLKDAIRLCIDTKKSEWRNAKHAQQWANSLTTYVEPELGSLPVSTIDTTLVLRVLEPIWTKKPETARRIRQRIEVILDWARVRGYFQGENPARWRGHLSETLPKPSKVRRVVHHPALPYAEAGAFIQALRQENGFAALALEFSILTAARTSEVIGATWEEIDLQKRIWTIPANRIKASREHRVPLSKRAIAILEDLSHRQGFVFPGWKKDKSLSTGAFLALLKRMKRDDFVPHGFRSTFRDWAAERTSFPREVCEAALAHAVSDKVEAAYRRSDLFEKRKRLMDAWAEHCEKIGDKAHVTDIASARQSRLAIGGKR